jgi:hypothetical protein
MMLMCNDLAINVFLFKQTFTQHTSLMSRKKLITLEAANSIGGGEEQAVICKVHSLADVIKLSL